MTSVAITHLQHIEGILCLLNSSCWARSLVMLSTELLWLVVLLSLLERGGWGQVKDVNVLGSQVIHLPAMHAAA